MDQLATIAFASSSIHVLSTLPKCVLSPWRRSHLQFVPRFQDLFRTGSNGDAFGEVSPTDRAGGIDQEFGRTRDVSAIRSSAFVQKAVPPDHFSLRIGKKCVSEAQLLDVLKGDLRRVHTDGNHPNTVCIEIRKTLLETPQLGVAKGSPVTAVENQQDAVRSRLRRPDRRR